MEKKPTPPKKTNTPIGLTKQEEESIKNQRAQQERRTACTKELEALLKKYNARLAVNPKSEIGNPQAYVIIQ